MDVNDRDDELAAQDLEAGAVTGPESGGGAGVTPDTRQTPEPDIDPDPVDDADPETTGAG